jgi:nicotinate-nucleotide adenylyltransferase
MTPRRRVGILGGTFDPIHRGHLDVGLAAEAALDLAELLVIPSHIPPHRPRPAASSFHRFAMVALSIAERPRWQVSDLELREQARSYTADTLRHLHANGLGGAELFFIIGADAFADIASWKDYPDLLQLAHFAVVSRPGLSASMLPQRLPALASRMRRSTAEIIGAAPVIILIDAPTADVSSTAIRQRVDRGEPIDGLVTVLVQQHIDRHRLYRRDEPASAGEPRAIDHAAGRLHGED